jgi:hypothetical protein
VSWRPPARADEVVRCYWKEGVNVGVSGMLRHYPIEDITFAVLAVGENAPWKPIFSARALEDVSEAPRVQAPA